MAKAIAVIIHAKVGVRFRALQGDNHNAALFVSNNGSTALHAWPLMPANCQCISNNVDPNDKSTGRSASNADKTDNVHMWLKVLHGLQVLHDIHDMVSMAASTAMLHDAEMQLIKQLFDLLL